MKILMVCLGNICRSPIAEGVMKKLIKENDLIHWTVDSAGIGDWHIGELPDKRAIHCARGHGIDITDQRARHLKKKDIQLFDHILVMDLMNYQEVINLSGGDDNYQKVKLLLDFKYPGEQRIVPDPYFTNLFEEAYQLIYEGCEGFLNYQLTVNMGNKLPIKK